MALVLLHTFWGVIFFDACEKRRYWCLGLVVASHLLTSGLVSLSQGRPRQKLSPKSSCHQLPLWARGGGRGDTPCCFRPPGPPPLSCGAITAPRAACWGALGGRRVEEGPGVGRRIIR